MMQDRDRFAVGVLLLCGCTAATSYDPNWESEEPLAGGKADGILDIVPAALFGETYTGTIGGEEFDLYRIDLQATDELEVVMAVTDGDLEPHLSMYRGTSTYVSSLTWDSSGGVLRKTYEVDTGGTYLIAARAYRGQGRGEYRLELECTGGPCDGATPPPADLDRRDVHDCIDQAWQCAFERLPAYDGRVGATRAALIMQGCLDDARAVGGRSCASACSWVNPADNRDTAREVCDSFEAALPFYADQGPECLRFVGDCMSTCAPSGATTPHSFGLAGDAVPMCWTNGFNASCDGYARRRDLCGGPVVADSAADCELSCRISNGVFRDDLSGLCGRDAGCDSFCDTDIERAIEACGGDARATRACIVDYLDDSYAYICVSQVPSAFP